MKRTTSIFALIFCSLLQLQLTASVDFNDRCKEAYQNGLKFHFKEMNQLLSKEKKANPENIVAGCIETYAHFLKYISSEDSAALANFEIQYERCTKALEEEDINNPYRLYLLTDLQLQSAFINGVKSNYLTSLIRFKKAYNSIQENHQLFPDFELNKKAMGLLNIGIGSIPKAYNWALTLLNLEGDLKTGQLQLKSLLLSCESNPDYQFLFTESLFLYSFTQSNYEAKNRRSKVLERLYHDTAFVQTMSNDQLFAFAKVTYHQHRKENDQAISALESIQQEFESNPDKLYYLDYLFGECLLFKLDHKSSSLFKRYINEYPGINYIRSARYKAGWGALIAGNKQEYDKQLQLILNSGAEVFDADKQALKKAKSAESPNIGLLKSRFLFDGGYYAQADSTLRQCFLNKELKTERENLEYTYRLARIHDEWNNFTLAEVYYKTTIKNGSNFKYYFAANSALHLAYRYESMGRNQDAQEMYQLCLELDFDEYHNSITQKAKAGLNRLEN